MASTTTGSNHNHHHHHRRQKGTTAALVQALKPKELNRMLDLASDLSNLNIVSPSKLKGNKDSDEDKKQQNRNSTSKSMSTNNRFKFARKLVRSHPGSLSRLFGTRRLALAQAW